MSNIWFTADTHLFHKNIIKYCDRPFFSTKEMNNTIVENWNNVVNPKDIVYHLGDFVLTNSREEYVDIVHSLNGRIVLIRGDHDKVAVKCTNTVEDKVNVLSNQIFSGKLEDKEITMCHYCMKVWPKSHYNSYHIHGHSHGGLKSSGKIYDVGVDCNNFTPISLNELIVIMNSKPDNLNLVTRR